MYLTWACPSYISAYFHGARWIASSEMHFRNVSAFLVLFLKWAGSLLLVNVVASDRAAIVILVCTVSSPVRITVWSLTSFCNLRFSTMFACYSGEIFEQPLVKMFAHRECSQFDWLWACVGSFLLSYSRWRSRRHVGQAPIWALVAWKCAGVPAKSLDHRSLNHA